MAFANRAGFELVRPAPAVATTEVKRAAKALVKGYLIGSRRGSTNQYFRKR